MLDDFIEKQPLAYKVLKNSLIKNKCSHAYVIESSDNVLAMNLAVAFAKSLFCQSKFTKNNENCSNCYICKKIDDKSFLDLVIIEPDGTWIKKGQLEELRNNFKNKSLNENKRVYIINNAGKLNVSSSNSILKFLEDPEEGIVALLIVKSIYELLPTILSRCQVISLGVQIPDIEKDLLSDALKVLEFIEKEGLKTIIAKDKLLNKSFKERESLENLFSALVYLYREIINIKIDYQNSQSNDILKEVSKNNSLVSLCKKTSMISDLKEKIKYNLNTGLLTDRLIIEIERIGKNA